MLEPCQTESTQLWEENKRQYRKRTVAFAAWIGSVGRFALLAANDLR
jgi:hypothetical protein